MGRGLMVCTSYVMLMILQQVVEYTVKVVIKQMKQLRDSRGVEIAQLICIVYIFFIEYLGIFLCRQWLI